jgi:hypothetical protein
VSRAGARIAVSGGKAARSFLRAELADVRFVTLGSGESAGEAVRDADMLVFVADEDETPDAARIAALAEAARTRGILVAALIVAAARSPGRSPLLATLRQAADMVIVIREPNDVQAVVAALR